MRGVQPLADVLASRSYPGRGCLAARSANGDLLLCYFLTGRSEASRARSIRTRPDGDMEIVGLGSEQDALRHYVAVARRGDWLVVGNGSQVVPIAEELARTSDVTTAWAPHTYEPDPPIFTPRVWMAWHSAQPLTIGQARRSTRPGGGSDRVAWLVEDIPAGSGVLLTTYARTIDNVITSTEPVDVEVTFETPFELSDSLWHCQQPVVRVGCLVVDPRGEQEVVLRTALA